MNNDLGEPVGCPFCRKKTVWAEIMTTVNFFSEHQMYSEDFNMEGVTLREILGEMKHAPDLKYMGFPDRWCKGIPHKDAAEYRMWGNGVALPCVLYVMEGISETLKNKKDV